MRPFYQSILSYFKSKRLTWNATISNDIKFDSLFQRILFLCNKIPMLGSLQMYLSHFKIKTPFSLKTQNQKNLNVSIDFKGWYWFKMILNFTLHQFIYVIFYKYVWDNTRGWNLCVNRVSAIPSTRNRHGLRSNNHTIGSPRPHSKEGSSQLKSF